MAVTSSLRGTASVPPRRSDRAHAGRARKWFVTLFAPDNKKREASFFGELNLRFGHFRRRVNDVDAWPARGCPHAGADPRRTGQALGEEVSHSPYNPDRTNPGHPRARRPTHKSKTRVPEISSHRDPPSHPPTPHRVPRRWTPADGKNKSSVYKWMPAEGDVESSPSERAAQFEAVPIGEVTVAMPAKTQKPAS